MNQEPLLSVDNLHTHFETDGGTVRAVDGVSFDVYPGETVCIVGESGSGKTITAETITQLFESPPGFIPEGSVQFDGVEVTEMDPEQLRGLRGARISHVFQNPQSALNPVYTIGWQIKEAIQLHQDVTEAEAHEQTIDLLSRVGIPEASARIDDYPHEFSGGMKQRAVIAIALACQPDLLIADEPTTALDVTIQAQILRLLSTLQKEMGMSIIFITHDLGVVAEIADRVVVMYSGKVMERGNVYDVFENPAHPYTRALLRCLPGNEGTSRGIPGQLPNPMDPPGGCRFSPRCPYAVEDCRSGDQPPLWEVDGDGHVASCIYHGPGYDPSVLEEDREVDADTSPTAQNRSDGGAPRSRTESSAATGEADRPTKGADETTGVDSK